MKKFLILTLQFLLVIIAGYLANESTKMITASAFGYESYYRPYIGRFTHHSSSMSDSFEAVRNSYHERGDTTDAYTSNKAWLELLKKDERDHAIIELSGKLFTLFISISGLFFWFYRRNNYMKIGGVDRLSLIMSLFFWREMLVIGVDLLNGSKLCVETKLWVYLGINWYYAEIVYFALGILFTIYILFKLLPKQERLQFIAAGIVGSIIGFIILVYFIGLYLF
jgi:hypothetical protein